MFFLLLLFVLAGATLTVLFWVVTLFLQGYYYTEPTTGIAWQAPSAGFTMAAFFTLWAFLIVSSSEVSPGNLPYNTFARFSPKVEKSREPIKKIWAAKKGSSDLVPYVLEKDSRRSRYLEDNLSRRPLTSPESVEALIIKEGDNTVRFQPQTGPTDRGYQEFADDEGWVMRVYTQTGPTGIPYAFRWGRFWVNIFLNLFHLGFWFACLWLLLRFQWSHALGLAIISWLVTSLAILPMILEQAGNYVIKK